MPRTFRSLIAVASVLLPCIANGQSISFQDITRSAETTVTQITIFTAKKVITMEPSNPEVTAVAVSGKRIVLAGSLDELKRFLGNQDFVVDRTFANRVLMPGLIDQHLHPVLGALTLAVEVIAPEDWALPGHTVKAAATPEEYLQRLKRAESDFGRPGEWFFTWGYHQYWHGTIDRAALDKINPHRPIAVWHRSCHEFYLNTAALDAIGLTREATQGKGQASEQSDWERGHFYEQGLNLIIGPVFKKLATKERMCFGLRQMVAYLHQNGVTAYNEPGALYTPDMWTLYEQILGADETPMYSTFLADGRGIPDRVGLDKALAATEEQIAVAPEGQGSKLMFFSKQIKLFADGAIISQLMQMKDGYLDCHRGEWITPPDILEQRFKLYWHAGYQLHIHVNGDAGLEAVIGILERRMREEPRPNHRTVIVHFANSSEEQVGRLARLGAIVSANPYYPTGFADKYSQIGLGPERADQMVRAGSVLKHHIPLSYHSDLPMAPSAPLFLAWCGVNRITPSGRIAAPDQRISVDAALRAVTIEAAYSWQKENVLGSIAPGKIANFTALEQDPYEVEPTRLKDIGIWGTVFEGRLFPVPQGQRRTALALATGSTSLGLPTLPNCFAHGVHVGPHGHDDSHACCACSLNGLLAKYGVLNSFDSLPSH